jgi:hypothetical protein
MRPRPLFLFLAAAAFAACGKEPAPSGSPAGKTGGTPVDAPHDDHGPRHGGHILEVGDEHAAHLEIVHDAATGTLTAYVYDGDMKPIAVEAPVINLTKGGTQVAMTPLSGAGPKADAWKAVDPALQADPLDGRMRLKIGDRTYQPMLEDEHGH